MFAFLSLLVVTQFVGLGALSLAYIRARQSLERFSSIRDAEEHKRECARKAQAAQEETRRLREVAKSLDASISQYKVRVKQYQSVLGDFKTAAELKERIQRDTLRAQHLSQTLGKLERASQLDEMIRKQNATIEERQRVLDGYADAIGIARTAGEIAAKVQYHENLLAQLKADIEAVEETGELQEFGFYRPRFDFEASEDYKRQLTAVRTHQKSMLQSKQACIAMTEWTVDGNKREGQKMVNQQIKLMLRAFNGECDAAVERVRYNNVVSLESRIKRSFDAINKLGETKRIVLSDEYRKLKVDELHLTHEYQEKKQDEREEHQRIRDLMKEEEKVIKEIERATREAERDEAMKAAALEKAREELAQRAGEQTDKLERLVTKLETELKEALDRKAKAIARAQLTRSGHVYILSNVGTFGDGVYKIGLTRRLEPLERVRELGGASVPFPFDVHALIYSEDAPKLEGILHRHFASRRVNMVNLRREFFRVSLDEIRVAVAEHFGHVTFITAPKAEQYHKTVAMLRDLKQREAPLQIA